MKTFKDNASRTWTVAINVHAIKRVKAMLGVDLLSVVGGELIDRLVADPVLLCDVIYVICKPEADAAGVSDEDFGRAMAGDAVQLATDAMLEELADFFPSGKRQVLKKALAKLQTLEAKLINLAEQKIDSPELDKKIEQALATFGEPSTSSPESSASTPDP